MDRFSGIDIGGDIAFSTPPETDVKELDFDIEKLGPLGKDLIIALQKMKAREVDLYKKNISVADMLVYVLYENGVTENCLLPGDYAVQFNPETAKTTGFGFELIKVNRDKEGKVISSYVVNAPVPHQPTVIKFAEDMENGLVAKLIKFVNERISEDNHAHVVHSTALDQLSPIIRLREGYRKPPPKNGPV